MSYLQVIVNVENNYKSDLMVVSQSTTHGTISEKFPDAGMFAQGGHGQLVVCICITVTV